MKRLVARVMAFVAVMALAMPASADDAQIAKQIISKLRQQQQTAKLQGFDLGVQVDKGTVTMMGNVANAEQATLALDIARRVKGVKLVVNDLTVASPPAVQSVAATEVTAVMHEAASPAQPQPTWMPQPVATPAYASTGAVGSAAVGARRMMQSPQMRATQMPVAFAPATSVRTVSAQSPVAAADYVDGGYSSYDPGYSAGYSTGGATPMPASNYGGELGGQMSGNPSMPGYAWPSYASHPNYGAVTYPQQYSATAWPYIGPFYPYPQVPLGWRKVTLEWDDGWWFLDFNHK